MIAILSPAKSLNFEDPSPSQQYTLPDHTDISAAIIKKLETLSVNKLMSLMDISKNLATINKERYMLWQQEHSIKNSKQCIYAFDGDVYSGLQAHTFSTSEIKWAQSHLIILSGLYGYLRPLDLIQPYRLEMSTKLSVSRKKDLYAIWKDITASFINQTLPSHSNKCLINLASEEYSKSISRPLVKFPVIEIDFKEEQNGNYKIVSFFAKKARGSMSAFMIKNRLDNPEELKEFTSDRYGFNKKLSSHNHFVFTRSAMQTKV